MNLRQFGNFFKKAVAERATEERKLRIYPRDQADNKVVGSEHLLKEETAYEGKKNPNNGKGSVVIDTWWAIFRGLKNNINGDDRKLLYKGGNLNDTNLGSAAGAGSFPLPNLGRIKIEKEGTNEEVDLTRGENENWQEVGLLAWNKHAQIGYLLGLLFASGYEASEIRLDPQNNLVVNDSKGIPITGGFAGLLKHNKLENWYQAVSSSPVPSGLAELVRKKLSTNPLPPGVLTFAGSHPEDHKKIIREWLVVQENLGIHPTRRLQPFQIQICHMFGWNPSDLRNNGAGDVRAIHPVTGAELDGIGDITTVGKLMEWRNAVDSATPTNAAGFGFGFRSKLKKSSSSGFGFGGSSSGDNLLIIDRWLDTISQQGIDPQKLTPAHVQRLHQQYWNPEEIVGNPAEEFGKRDFKVIHPDTGLPTPETGFDAIDGLGSKKDLWNAITFPTPNVPLVPNPNLGSYFSMGGNLVEEWLSKRAEFIKKFPHQAGKISGELSGGNIKTLSLEGWIPNDIDWDENGAGGDGALKVLVHDGPEKYKIEVEDFAEISALGGKIRAQEVELPRLKRAKFRAAALEAHNKNKDGRGNLPTSAHTQLHENNELNNFIIDQYFQGLNFEDAVDAFNNGWIYGLEICQVKSRTSGEKIRGVNKNGGERESWEEYDWKKNGKSRQDYLNGLTSAAERDLMNAFQIDDNGARWIPPLSDSEKNSLRRGRKTTRQIRIDRLRENYLDKVRKIAATTPGSPAALAFGTIDAPVPGSNFIIDQYFYDEEITPREVVQAYNNDWIYGLEVGIEEGRKKCWFLDNADNECILRDINWTTTKRGILYNALSPEKKAKADALQLNHLNQRWNPELVEKEWKRILNAPDATTATNLREVIQKEREFQTDFESEFGPFFGFPPYSDDDILGYFGKNLTGQQAAQLFQGDPRVLGSELIKGNNDKEVIFNGTVYKVEGDIAGTIIAAKQAKIDADEAAEEAARQAAKLTEVQTAAETAIKNAQQATDNKPEITDAELNQYLKDTEKILNDNLKTWLEYIKQEGTKDEVKARKNKVLLAIKEIRKIKRNLVATRTKAITAVKNYWKKKSSDKSENGLVNGKKITEILGNDWEREFDKQVGSAEIENYKKELIAKINTEKAQENPQKTPPKLVKKLTNQQVVLILQNVLDNPAAKINPQVIKSWQSFNNAKSQLKTTTQVKAFLEVVKNNEADFAKHLAELPEKPTGQNDKEKITNFLTKHKSQTVIKTILGYQLKDDTFRVKTEIEMENQQSDDEQPLDEKIYPQKDGEYTQKAMVRYLYEKKTGQTHQFAMKEEEEENNSNSLVVDQSHWNEWKYWYIGSVILILVVALVLVFRNKLIGSTKPSKKNK